MEQQISVTAPVKRFFPLHKVMSLRAKGQGEARVKGELLQQHFIYQSLNPYILYMYLLLLNWPHRVLGQNTPWAGHHHRANNIYTHSSTCILDHAKVHICHMWRLIHPWRKPTLGILHTKNPRAWAQTWDSQEARRRL